MGGREAWVVWLGAESVRFGEAVLAEPALGCVGSAQGSALELGRITRLGAGSRFNCRGLMRWRMIVPAPQRQSRDVIAGDAVASQEGADADSARLRTEPGLMDPSAQIMCFCATA